MRVAIVGSRGITSLDLSKFINDDDEIITGGATGVDTLAIEYARIRNISLRVFFPEYNVYGRAAPIIRNKKIVDYADRIIAFWDGSSRGTLSVIKYAKSIGKECEIIYVKESSATDSV
jgi:hypothetical protein